MDSEKKRAITAIRSIALESQIAETLHRLGWILCYRATSAEGLESAIKSNPEAIVIAAKDFPLTSTSHNENIVMVNQAMGEFELNEKLNKSDLVTSSSHPNTPLFQGNLSVVATIDAGVGGSTLAMNIAHQSVLAGKKTLLFDFNIDSPSLSRYFDLHQINRKFVQSRFGFSLGEISHFAHFTEMAADAAEFDSVIVDLGRAPKIESLQSGHRIHEALSRWAIKSAGAVALLARSDQESCARLAEVSRHLITYSTVSSLTGVLISQSQSSSRDKREIAGMAASFTFGRAQHLSRDVRNLAKARTERAPIAIVAPKCALSREISNLYREVFEGDR